MCSYNIEQMTQKLCLLDKMLRGKANFYTLLHMHVCHFIKFHSELKYIL